MCLLFALHHGLQDMQQAAVQHLQAIFDMPAANSSTDGPDAPPSNSSSSSQQSFLTPVWMSRQELQQLAANQPRSSAAYGSTRLCSGAGAATFHPELTLPYDWQPATSIFMPPVEVFTADSFSSQSSTALPPLSSSSSDTWVDVVDSDGSTVMVMGLPPSSSQVLLLERMEELSDASTAAALPAQSSSSEVEVDLVDSNGSTQMALLLDPLSSTGVLFEDSQDFSGPGAAAAAAAAERDEAYAAMR
jgi:hypothetical protein